MNSTAQNNSTIDQRIGEKKVAYWKEWLPMGYASIIQQKVDVSYHTIVLVKAGKRYNKFVIKALDTLAKQKELEYESL